MKMVLMIYRLQAFILFVKKTGRLPYDEPTYGVHEKEDELHPDTRISNTTATSPSQLRTVVVTPFSPNTGEDAGGKKP